MQHKFYNLISLKLADNVNQDISSLSGSFPYLAKLHLGYKFNKDISSLSGSFPPEGGDFATEYIKYKVFYV
jgi:hypothetical protein